MKKPSRQSPTLSKSFSLVTLGILLIAAILIFSYSKSAKTSPTASPSSSIKSSDPIALVANLDEVKSYLAQVPNAKVELDHEETNSYIIHVYEIKNGHTATFNWYIIDKTTRKITKEFEFEQGNSEEFENFTDQTAGIAIFYPPSWQLKKDTQIFEKGDIVTFQETGPTQKAGTDFYDGARLTIGKPFSEKKDAQTWAKDYYGFNNTTYSTEKINVTDFVKVSVCADNKCQTYYHAKKNNKIYSIFVFAEGENKLKNQVLLKEALDSLTF